MKKWQKRKLRDELICLAIAIVGLIFVLNHFTDMCPWLAWIGGFMMFGGCCCYFETRERDYRPKKTR